MAKHFFASKIELINKEHEDLGIDISTKYVSIIINLDDVSAFRQTMDDDMEINNEQTTLYMKSGETFTIQTPYKTIGRILNNNNS